MIENPYRDPRSAATRCPLDSTPLDTVEHASGQKMERCAACHGVWLEEDRLKTILRWAERTPADENVESEPRAVLAYEMGKQKHREPVVCPRCGGELISEERGSHSYVLVDVCPEGCGTWLDDEELRRLIAYMRGRFSKR